MDVEFIRPVDVHYKAPLTVLNERPPEAFFRPIMTHYHPSESIAIIIMSAQ